MPRTKLPVVSSRRLVSAASSQSSLASSSVTSSSSDDPIPSPPAEFIRYSKRRSRKAERDERHDITLSLTEVKQYMGGFTRPQDLRASSWYPGGHYIDQRRTYEPPYPDAYHPRTVYLLEGRYPTVYGHGRQDTYPRHLGVCGEGDLPSVVELSNSTQASSDLLEAMDNARWPWDKPRRSKRVRWWEDGEDPAELRRQALEGTLPEPLMEQQPTRHTKPRSVPTELLALGPAHRDAPHLRAFHTSAVARTPSEDDRDSFERRRRDLPTSAWSRPPRPSQDADDNVVPTYYVERKKQRDSISQRKEEEGGLMAELNAGVLSEGLAAETRAREEKIPVELRLPDGTIAHPSGFEPPTAETEFHPVAAKVPTEEHPLLSTVKQPWDEREFVEAGAEPIRHDPETEAEWIKRMIAEGNGAMLSGVRDINAERPAGSSQTKSSTSPEDRSKISTSAWDTPSRSTHPDPDEVVPSFYIERKRQRDDISLRKEEEGSLMAELNAGILSDELAAQTRERHEKIPVEVVLDDGTIAHPSGFEPPTPETDFHPVAAKPGDAPKQPWVEVLATKKPSDSRGFHTSAVARATEVPLTPLQRALRAEGLLESSEPTLEADPVPLRRAAYLPTLPSAPFWRPLLTVTLSTRPLANSLERLAHGLPRGNPFYAAIADEERKDFATYNARLRNLQLNRVQALTRAIGARLAGRHGGFVGLRTGAEQKGRGVLGEGLADPLPRAVRVVKVGVGEWYAYAEEVKERFLRDAEEGGYADCIEVFGVDEWGRRTDGKAWEGERARGEKVSLEELVESEGPAKDVD